MAASCPSHAALASLFYSLCCAQPGNRGGGDGKGASGKGGTAGGCEAARVCSLLQAPQQRGQGRAQSRWQPCASGRPGASGCGRLTPAITSSHRALGPAPGIRYPSPVWLRLPLPWVRGWLEGPSRGSGLWPDTGDSQLPGSMHTMGQVWTSPAPTPGAILPTGLSQQTYEGWPSVGGEAGERVCHDSPPAG